MRQACSWSDGFGPFGEPPVVIGGKKPVLAPIASAEPKDDVAAAALTWAQALGEDNPDKMLPFYSDDAVLWELRSPKIILP
jgi:hypothetical protein